TAQARDRLDHPTLAASPKASRRSSCDAEPCASRTREDACALLLADIELVEKPPHGIDASRDLASRAWQEAVTPELQKRRRQHVECESQHACAIRRRRPERNVEAELALVRRHAVDEVDHAHRIGLVAPRPSEMRERHLELRVRAHRLEFDGTAIAPG